MRNVRIVTLRLLVASLCLAAAGCGNFGLFSPSFLNSTTGGAVPVTPGPNAGFILVRTVNDTNETVEFVVTVELSVPTRDASGNFVVDDQGNFVFQPGKKTVFLNTQPTGRANEVGVLFDCRNQRVTRVGLGENLLPTDAAALVGGQGAAGEPGFGIPASTVNPLTEAANNYDCGDTIIFRAVRSIGIAGGVVLQSFLLPGSEQPSVVTGPNTFANYEAFLETQVQENEP